ncbi:hypothetical protein N5E99_11735 [Pseudomonas chengduensis]|jgi:hypothetical protein|uniref:Uncharacterized protein n=1 Tax=Ectopseudomonas chengduensis TaxID=489632 RepID=A0A1G6KN54_9GAMM|nr:MULTISPECIES: hypothetical protein [Pseudomonas]MDH0957510.1 hypothetical protein [Pseudomonas chengduensis]MDH1536423.1 hypothetical protein [Pseudomonas chengduensis]SDC32347.1 hypothetical protein SAMN05216576_102125 [Pseudomonas chengduensis]
MKHPHARQFLGFYRSCYLADSRDLDLDNLGKLPANRWAWLDGCEELASGGIPLLPLSAELGRALAEAQALYQCELQLVYGVLPNCGRLQLEGGGSQAICGPLFYYEASLQAMADGQSHLLAIDPQQVHGNWRLLRICCAATWNSCTSLLSVGRRGLWKAPARTCVRRSKVRVSACGVTIRWPGRCWICSVAAATSAWPST